MATVITSEQYRRSAERGATPADRVDLEIRIHTVRFIDTDIERFGGNILKFAS